MAVSYVDGAVTGGNPTTSLTFTVPAGAALNDLMCLEFTHRGTGDGTVSDNSGDGVSWTRKGEALFATDTFTVQSYYKRVTAAMVGGGETVTVTGLTNSSAGTLTLYRGVIETGDPFDAWTPEANASGDESHAAISATVADTMVCLIVGNSPDLSVTSPSTTSPGALSIRQEKLSTGGTDASCMHASAQKTGTGSTGALTWAQTNAASGSIAYILKPVPPPTQTAVAEVSLGTGSTPVARTGHSIKVRARTTSGAGTMRAALYEGANNRSGDLESSALTTSLADYTLSISEANANNITDYSDLAIRFWGYAAGGGAIVFEVDQLYLETPEAAAAAYSLNAEPGSFSITGAAATATADETIDAQDGSYAVTGNDATLAVGTTVSADPGAYAVNGAAATLLAASVTSADPGSYAVTGVAATLAAAQLFQADPGAYAVTGMDASLAVGTALSADPGSYIITGQAADLAAGHALSADQGTYALTGFAATLLTTSVLSADPGVYAITGAAAELELVGSFTLTADPGSYAVTGTDAALAAGRIFTLDPGVYAVTGAQTDLLRGLLLDANPGAYVLTGFDAELAIVGSFTLGADPGSYAVTGPAATLSVGYAVSADSGVYTVTGAAAGLIADLLVAALPGAYLVNGAAAQLVVGVVGAGTPGSVVSEDRVPVHASGSDTQAVSTVGGDRTTVYAAGGDRRSDP